MARGGINKALVEMARERLLAKGENPSIDAVRVELGNTGSKATIHRYLKELNDETGSRLRDKEQLSDPLTELVSRLAFQLHHEAQAVVAEAETLHQAQVTDLNNKLATLQQAGREAETQIAMLTEQLADLVEQRRQSQADHHAQTIQVERLQQKLESQALQLEDRDNHLKSLEEKHQYARDSLTHYREAVKEQRDQEQRRHEQQVQQLQAELRQLNQTLVLKQTDITQLNIDNARLVTENRALEKQRGATDTTIQQLESQLKASETQLGVVTGRLEASTKHNEQYQQELASLKQQIQDNEDTQQNLELKVAELTTELTVKNDMFNKLRPESRTG